MPERTVSGQGGGSGEPGLEGGDSGGVLVNGKQRPVRIQFCGDVSIAAEREINRAGHGLR